MEILKDTQPITLLQRERKIEDEAPAIRLKMYNGETKVVGMMADKVQVFITISQDNTLDKELLDLIIKYEQKCYIYTIFTTAIKDSYDTSMCSTDFLNISKKLGVLIDETTCTNSIFIINKEGIFTYIQIPKNYEDKFDLEAFEEALNEAINFKRKGHVHEDWMSA